MSEMLSETAEPGYSTASKSRRDLTRRVQLDTGAFAGRNLPDRRQHVRRVQTKCLGCVFEFKSANVAKFQATPRRCPARRLPGMEIPARQIGAVQRQLHPSRDGQGLPPFD